MHRALEWLSRRTGYHLLSSWRLRHHAQVDHLRDLFARYGIDVVIDVGANKGQFRGFLRQLVGFTGPIVSCEPTPHLVEYLRERSRDDPRWEIEPVAMGTTVGTIPFHVMARDSFSSVLNPENTSASDRLRASNTIASTINVPVRTVADLWPEIRERYGARRPFLKIDTQGYDLQVLAGADPVLAEIPAGQCEVLFRTIYQGAPTVQETLSAWAERGLEIAGFFPESHDEAGRLRACDVSWINRSFAEGAERSHPTR